MSPGRRLKYRLYTAYWGLLYSIPFMLGIAFLMMQLDPALEDRSIKSPEVLFAIMPAVIIGCSLSYLLFRRDVTRSDRRMANAAYRTALQQLGYLRDKTPD